MHLIVGLGNPGTEYAGNRHNIGFMAADEIARRHGFSGWRNRDQGIAAEGEIGGERVLLLKPMTYMNNSGASVGPVARFFKIEPAAVIVIHDELDLAPGKVRVKTGGGAAGHNGLRSIAQLFSADTKRLRLGIGHPGDKDRVQGYVLSDFAKADREWLLPLLDAVAEAVPLLVAGRDSEFMTKVALLAPPPKPARPPRPAEG